MKKMQLIETYDNTRVELLQEQSVNESKSDTSRVDGKYIIGMIEGQFFQPDGMSRNRRWYPRELWETALNSLDVKNRFATSTMFGEIGHSEGPVVDLTLRNGCASHFVDKMWIDEKGRGMGRAYILNTPTGNLLKTYLGAGCKLKVSTRGEGLYKDGETHDGSPVIDPDSYELQTADFVLNPGFIETSANLRESYNSIEKEITQNKKQIEETIAHVKKEGEKRMTLDMEAYVRELKEEMKSLKDENKSLTEELKAKDKELLQKQFGESAEVKKLTEELTPYKKLNSSAKSLKETFAKSQELLKKATAEKTAISEELESYKAKCGTLEEVEEATNLSAKSLKIVEEYRKLGTPAQIRTLAVQSKKLMESAAAKKSQMAEAKAMLESYKKFGTVEEVEALVENTSKLLPQLEEYKKLAVNASRLLAEAKEVAKLKVNATKLLEEAKASKGLEATCRKAIKALKAYKEQFGALKTTKPAMQESATAVKTEVKTKKLDEALSLSKKFNCTVEEAGRLVKEHGMEKATSLLESKVETKTATKLESGKKLVETNGEMDAPKETELKPADEYLKKGMIKSYFDDALLGREETLDINKINPEAELKQNQAKELLAKYSGTFEVADAPKVETK